LRRLNRMVARQPEEEEEDLQTKARRAKKPEDEQKTATVRRSVETEDEEKQQQAPLQKRIRRKAAAKPPKEEEKPVAAKLYRKTAPAKPEEESTSLQKKLLRAAGATEEEEPTASSANGESAAPETSPTVEERIENSRGSGAPLPETVLREMENQLGQDLSQVVIHNDEEAAALCKELNARAFTVGNDIYFAPGEFAPGTGSGRELLAHELTHVVQQGAGVQTNRIARKGADGKGNGGKGTYKKNGKKGELHIPSLTLPDKPGMQDKFKEKYGTFVNWTLPKAEKRRDQSEDWKSQIEPAAKSWDLAPYLTDENRLPDTGNTPQYALKLKESGSKESGSKEESGSRGGYLIGTPDAIRKRAILPWWDKGGVSHLFDVDHILELQLGGAAISLDNLQLLDASANRSSGSKIHNEIDKAISAAIPPKVEEDSTLPESLAKPLPSSKKGTAANTTAKPASGSTTEKALSPHDAAMAAVKANPGLDIVFDEVKFSGSPRGNPDICWPAKKIVAMDHIKVLEKANKDNSKELFDDEKLRIMPRPGAGLMFYTALKGNPDNETFAGGSWGGLKVKEGGSFKRNEGSGEISVTIPGTRKVAAAETKLNFVSSGVPTLCHLVPGQIGAAYRNKFKAATLSPIVLNDADLDANADIVGNGVLTIDGIPLLAGTTMDVSLVGGDLVFSKTFSTDEFNLQGPIQLDSSSLTLSAGAATPIEATGLVEFHIGELAKGSLEGRTTANGFAMTGKLEFDKQLFTGNGTISYDSAEGMDAHGSLGLKPGALKGVKKARFTLAYDDKKKAIDFSGDAELSVPGFKGAQITAHADDGGNVSLGGEAQLADTIPRIKAGKLNVSAERKGDVWSLGGGGELEPDLDGMDASAKIGLNYRDGVLKGELTASYKRSIMSGSVTLNAEAMVGDDGGEAEPIKVWGSGSVDITVAPWLKATAGLTLDQKGEITVSGKLGLPSSLEIFPRKEINKSLVNIAVQIPIVPGIVAEVGGGLNAVAGIGPGVIDKLELGITYNPAHEEDTRITGGAHLRIPADAGLRLSARAGIGLGVTGVSVTGGLEIGGTLGIQGALEAGVDINWTPKEGLTLAATLSMYAQPCFTFSVAGYVNAQALGFSVYYQSWDLAALTLGSDYRVGIILPLRYQKGEFSGLSLDDVKFIVPDISPGDILSGLIDRIA